MVELLTLRAECSLFTLKPAHLSRLLPDLLYFVTDRKDLLFDGQGNQRLEVGGLGITASCFPLPTARLEMPR